MYLRAPEYVKRLRLDGRSAIAPGGSPAAEAPACRFRSCTCLYVAVHRISGADGPGHVHMVDSVPAVGVMKHRFRRSVTIWRCRQERSVKPSAQPTLVRTQHLPPPAKTGPLAADSRAGGPFLLGPGVCHLVALRTVMLRCPRTHSGRASVLQGRSVCTVTTVGVHSCGGRCTPSAIPRTATDGPH